VAAIASAGPPLRIWWDLKVKSALAAPSSGSAASFYNTAPFSSSQMLSYGGFFSPLSPRHH
jgi:hypothetical protein